jgi:hypothetical protein
VVELPSVLWRLCTTPCRVTSFTPFFMVHDSEAVLPTDIDYDSPRVQACTVEGKQVVLEDAIDQLDEARDVALLRCASINKLYDAATSATCALASSMSETWSSDKFRASRIDTILHRLGRGCSSSTRCSDPEHTRSDTRTDESSPTRGTSNT